MEKVKYCYDKDNQKIVEAKLVCKDNSGDYGLIFVPSKVDSNDYPYLDVCEINDEGIYVGFPPTNMAYLNLDSDVIDVNLSVTKCNKFQTITKDLRNYLGNNYSNLLAVGFEYDENQLAIYVSDKDSEKQYPVIYRGIPVVVKRINLVL